MEISAQAAIYGQMQVSQSPVREQAQMMVLQKALALEETMGAAIVQAMHQPQPALSGHGAQLDTWA